MNAALNSFKQAKVPLGEQPGAAGLGGDMSAALNRFKQAKTPSGSRSARPGAGAT